MFLDCDTQDVKRLEKEMARLAVAFQAMQNEVTKDMNPRDQMIVTLGSINLVQVAAERTAKQCSTPRFVRTVKQAMLIARKFGVGRIATQAPTSE